MTGTRNEHNAYAPVIVSKTKAIIRLTIFRPRPNARYGDRVVDERAFLGSFRSNTIDSRTGEKTLYVRLSASNSIPTGNPEKPFDAQWGRMVAFGELAKQVVSHIVGSAKGTHITVNAHCRQEIVQNYDAQGTQHTNTVWVVYGYELGNEFFTTKKGVLSVGPLNNGRVQEAQDASDDLFEQMEQEVNTARKLDWGGINTKNQNDQARLDRDIVMDPQYVSSITELENNQPQSKPRKTANRRK